MPFRTLRRDSLVSLVAILSLAIGMAAVSTMFSVADALFLRARPGVSDEHRLLDIGRATDSTGFDNFNVPVLRAIGEDSSQFSGIAGYRFDPNPVSVEDSGGVGRAFALPVTANYFEVLGARAAVGRFFRPEEDVTPDAVPVVVLSHGYWQRHFGGDPAAVGGTLRMNGRPYTIVGVAEPGFAGTTFIGSDVWVPFAMAGSVTGRPAAELFESHVAVWHLAIGRLRDGVTPAQARAELNARLAPLKLEHPREYGRWTLEVLPSGRVPGELRSGVGAFVTMLLILTALVLAVACSNVAGALLARGLARRREWATRLAVGATRGQLVRQLLLEALVLTTLATALGSLLSTWMMALVQASLPELPFPLAVNLELDTRGLAVAALIGAATTVAAGLAPALRVTRVDLAGALHGQYGTDDRHRLWLRNGLVATQVALSVVLLVATALFARSVRAAASIDTGYRAGPVRIYAIDTSLAGYSAPRSVDLAGQLMAALHAAPGVEAVAVSRMPPLNGGRFGLGALQSDAGQEVGASWDVVSPEYFTALGVSLVQGRSFVDADRQGRPDVAIVNETLARQLWPGESAVGRVLTQATARDRFDRPLTIVGVARDTRHRSITEPPRPFIYVPFAQQPVTELQVYVRAATPPDVAEVQRQLSALDPGLPVLSVSSFEATAQIGIYPQRLAAGVAGGVAGLGLVLTLLGLYGLMAYQAVRRAREMAVRRAIGATENQVWRLLLGQGLLVAARGGAVGLLLAGAAAIGIRGLLVGVVPLDVTSFAAAAGVVAVAAVAACVVPARRAARTDPALLLRAE